MISILFRNTQEIFKPFTFAILVLLVCSQIISCKKKVEGIVQNADSNDIYIAGWDNNASFWKNDTVHTLAIDFFSQASSVFVNGNDIYIGGWISTGNVAQAAYWKNGHLVTLDSSSNVSQANSIFVSGKDVYVAGSVYVAGNPVPGKGRWTAWYWKNGVGVNLPAEMAAAFATSVFVQGNDVYVAGYEYKIPQNSNEKPLGYARFWKNGIPFNLNDGSAPAYAKSIFVSGSDVYVAGFYPDKTNGNNIATYWKNGIATGLTDSSENAFTNSIFVNGNDVYLAGYTYISNDNHIAACWKNGVALNLPGAIEGAEATSVFVKGNNVYVAGTLHANSGLSAPVYWKNGTLVKLSVISALNQARATSIFVK